MTRPRSALVSVADTPYYHCIGRCVRRAFLCGDDPVTGKSFSHRRQWILDRLKLLTATFAIDLCAYALMSNHYHFVVRIDAERARHWSSRDVVERWTRLFRGPEFVARYLKGEPLSTIEQSRLEVLIPRWSARLTDLSWFMRCMNEWIARLANQEDGCTGRFWEGRFKSQALLDDTALLTAMVYVDLNPIRAGLADAPIDADFTSVQQRLFDLARRRDTPPKDNDPPALLPFAGTLRQGTPTLLPFNLQDYLDLVDTSGRVARSDKRGTISVDQPKLLAVLGIQPHEWFKMVTQLQARFEHFVGSPHRLREIAARRGWRWVRGLTAARRLYARANE